MSIDMKCQMSWDVKFHGAKCPPGTHLLILGIFSNRNWFWTLIPWWIWWLWLLWWLRSPRSHEMLTDMICRPTWNAKYHEMSSVMKYWFYDPKQKPPELHTSERTIVPQAVIFSTVRCSKRTSLLSRIHPSIQSIHPLIALEQSKQFRTYQDSAGT